MQTMEYIRLNRHLSGAVFCLILTISAAFAPTMALCQSSSSAVNGVVTDPENAVVPGAQVTLRNVDTNVERITVSNASWRLLFLQRAAGTIHTYIRRAELPDGDHLGL